MIRRDGSYEVDIRRNMRGGQGQVTIEHLWKKDELKGRTRLCARLTLQPGSSIGFHEHVDEEEVFYVVSGAGLVQDAGTENAVAAGDTILTGGGAGHAVEATGDTPLVMLAVIVQY